MLAASLWCCPPSFWDGTQLGPNKPAPVRRGLTWSKLGSAAS